MLRFLIVTALLTLSATASATTFPFNTDPFAGSTALTTPGRQIVGSESFISFDTATDVFALGSSVFGVGDEVHFANDVVGNLPTGGVNVIVLETLDNDGDPTTPFGAGNAASLIAGQITSPGPGFFIYFNSGLNLPRLVFSTDLDDNTADLKVLFRMTNLSGQPDALPTFTASNFAFVPEPSTLMLLAAAGVLGVGRTNLRRRRGPREQTLHGSVAARP
jgi:PEP-CTERM motif